MWSWEWNGSWLLDFQQGLDSKPRHWEEDELVTQCPSCLSHFNLFIRRHHCRNCGGVFCSECTSERVKVVGYENEERVCAICFENLRSDVIFFNKGGGVDAVSRWKLLIGRVSNGRAKEGEVISRIYEGVPESVRADMWYSLCTMKSKSSTSKYSTLIQPNPQFEEKIQMDITRTFPDNAMIQSEKGQLALSHLLSGLIALYPSMGYAQHSAYVAGVVLVVMGWEREEDAFWVLAQLFEKAKGPLATGRVDAAVDYVRAMLEASHPDLAVHLASHRITLDVFVHRWLSTLFSYDLPLPFALRVWDLLLVCGHLFGPALALALLDRGREELMRRDANAIVQYFNHLPPSLFPPEEGTGSSLLDDAFTHWSHIRRK